jgi:hypothetical protein
LATNRSDMMEDTFDYKLVFEPVKFEYRDFFWKRLGPDNWSFSYPTSCDFCQEPAEYHSNTVELKSCKSCLNLLWNLQLDSLNQTLHQLFRTWIDRHFNLQMPTSNPSEEYVCYVCRKNIEHRLSIFGSGIRYVELKDKSATAHEECISNKHIGFANFFSEEDYQMIIDTYIQPQLLKSLNEVNLKQETNCLISLPFDLMKINALINHNDFSIRETNIDHFGVSNWIPFQNGQCSFCNDPEVVKKNEHFNLLGCRSCLQDLTDGEIDIVNPNDHLLSQKIHNIICDGIQKNYFVVVDSDIVFNEYFIKHNICYSCGNKIENCEVAIFAGGNSMAHHNCISESGFVGLLTENDFKDIISTYFEEDILDNLDK